MIDLQDIITTKRELLSRETYSRNPINYSAGMAEDQKDRYIQYLAEQNQDLRLTGDAMRLVLEDFMAQMKELKDQMSSMQSKHVDLENRLSEEHKLRKSAERKIKSLQEKLDYANQERFGDRRQKIQSKAKTSDSDRLKKKHSGISRTILLQHPKTLCNPKLLPPLPRSMRWIRSKLSSNRSLTF